MANCTHPWAMIVTIEDDELQCTACCEVLSKREIALSRANEIKRLSDELAQAYHDLVWGSAEYPPHMEAYRQTLRELQKFTATSAKPLPI